MAELLIRSEDIARRLLDLAGMEQRSVDALLDDMLATYEIIIASLCHRRRDPFAAARSQ